MNQSWRVRQARHPARRHRPRRCRPTRNRARVADPTTRANHCSSPMRTRARASGSTTRANRCSSSMRTRASSAREPESYSDIALYGYATPSITSMMACGNSWDSRVETCNSLATPIACLFGRLCLFTHCWSRGHFCRPAGGILDRPRQANMSTPDEPASLARHCKPGKTEAGYVSSGACQAFAARSSTGPTNANWTA